MSNETVDDLIQQLKNIRLQESEVLDRLYRARQLEKEEREANTDGPPTPSSQLKEGDRVTITNGIRTPFGRRANIGDRNSTVLRAQHQDEQNLFVDTIRIHIRTDNGFTTWRLKKNLRRI
jgi:hypothetical protein